MNQYQDYPKQMTHPAHKPAIIVKWDPKLQPDQQKKGEPERFPSIVVHNKDQEQEYASKGYVPNGQSDPEAYRAAMVGNDTRPAGSIVEYPKWLYKVVEGDLKSELVNTTAEEKALGKGWHPNPDAARNAPAEVQAEAQTGKVSEAPAKAPEAQAEALKSPAGQAKGKGKGKAEKPVPASSKRVKPRSEARR